MIFPKNNATAMKEKNNHVEKRKIVKPEGMEIKQLLSRIADNWYWFAIAAIVGLVGGVLYNNYTNPNYQANTTILIKTEDKNAALKSLYKDLGINEKTTSIQNQVGVLSSY